MSYHIHVAYRLSLKLKHNIDYINAIAAEIGEVLVPHLFLGPDDGRKSIFFKIGRFLIEHRFSKIDFASAFMFLDPWKLFYCFNDVSRPVLCLCNPLVGCCL